MDDADTDMQPGRVKVSSETQFELTKESASNNAHEMEPLIGIRFVSIDTRRRRIFKDVGQVNVK